MFSILEMFTIGVGPSSSHTVGPMVAASRFAASLERDGILNRVGRVRTVLYGSLALTGLGTVPIAPRWRAWKATYRKPSIPIT